MLDKKVYLNFKGTLDWKPTSTNHVKKLAKARWSFMATSGKTFSVEQIPLGTKEGWDKKRVECTKPNKKEKEKDKDYKKGEPSEYNEVIKPEMTMEEWFGC